MIEQEQFLQDGRHFIGGRDVTDRQPKVQQEQPRTQMLTEQQQRSALPVPPPRPAKEPDYSWIPHGMMEP